MPTATIDILAKLPYKKDDQYSTSAVGYYVRQDCMLSLKGDAPIPENVIVQYTLPSAPDMCIIDNFDAWNAYWQQEGVPKDVSVTIDGKDLILKLNGIDVWTGRYKKPRNVNPNLNRSYFGIFDLASVKFRNERDQYYLENGQRRFSEYYRITSIYLYFENF